MNDEQHLPPDEVIIEKMPFDFQEHGWHQEGYTLICSTCPAYSRHGMNIPAGKMLMGSRGEWWLGPEEALKR